MTDETKLTPMQKVDELIERGKSKGELTYKEVIDTLGNDALDVDQMEVVYDRFEDADINVVEEIDPVEIAGEDVLACGAHQPQVEGDVVQRGDLGGHHLAARHQMMQVSLRVAAVEGRPLRIDR